MDHLIEQIIAQYKHSLWKRTIANTYTFGSESDSLGNQDVLKENISSGSESAEVDYNLDFITVTVSSSTRDITLGSAFINYVLRRCLTNNLANLN